VTKEDMAQVLRSVGVNENTVTAMCNAFDMGVEYEREACVRRARVALLGTLESTAARVLNAIQLKDKA
jgi:hypothetical protein